jgi:hypothetical protein
MSRNRIRYSSDFTLTDRKVGIGTSNPTSTLSVSVASTSRALDIGTDLLVSGSGAFTPRVTIGSTVNAASTQKMQISAISRDNGLLEIENYGGNQLFSISNNQEEDSLAVYRYGNFTNSSLRSFENRALFRVGPLGIVTTYGAIRVGTSNTIADSSVFNEFYGNVNIRSPFSTSTQFVSIVPRFNDRGALSFEAPIGAAQTDRGTQVFSISNNFDSSIFRVNDLNRNPILEANVSGRVGVGTTNPQARFEVVGTTRITSVGSTAGEQIDIRHYRNIAPQPAVGIATNNRGAISFDSPTGVSTDGVTFFPASLFAITNDPTGNIFSVGGYRFFSSNVGEPAIDVTQRGLVGIGTTIPREKFDVVGNTLIRGGIATITTLDVSSRLRVTTPNSTELQQINIGHISTTTVPSTGISRGAIVFDGISQETTNNGSQLLTILNDNSTLFGVSRILGITSTNPAPTGTRLTESVFDISSSGNIGIGGTNVPNRFEINPRNEFVSSVVSFASSIGISTTIISGINTSGISVGLEIQGFSGVIAAGTTVVSIGTSQIGIGRTTLNNFVRTSTVLTFGSRTNDRVVAITSTGLVGIGSTNPVTRLDVNGPVSFTDTRLNSVSEKSTIISGNTINLVYNTGGGNVAICTNPTGPITLNVTGIPTDSSFNNRVLTFTVIVIQGATGFACTTVNLNGVPEVIRYSGGIIPVGTNGSYDVFSFTGINTVGSASTASNYQVLGSLAGNFI